MIRQFSNLTAYNLERRFFWYQKWKFPFTRSQQAFLWLIQFQCRHVIFVNFICRNPSKSNCVYIKKPSKLSLQTFNSISKVNFDYVLLKWYDNDEHFQMLLKIFFFQLNKPNITICFHHIQSVLFSNFDVNFHPNIVVDLNLAYFYSRFEFQPNIRECSITQSE